MSQYCLLVFAALLLGSAARAEYPLAEPTALVTSTTVSPTRGSSTQASATPVASIAVSSTRASSAAVVLVLGDSLSAGYGIDPTQGWVSLLDRSLQQRSAKHRVVNISISGETTSGGLARLPAALQRWQPTAVIVALGGNDGLRATPLKLVEQNLSQLIAMCRDQGASVVLAGMRIPPNYGPRYAEAFFAIYAKLASRHAVPLVPFLLEGIATDPALMQADGLHPGVDAQRRILENVKPVLTTVLEG